MIGDDHIVPVVRAATLRRYGRPLKRRLNAASAILSTLELRGLNQQVIDGRLPEAVGGEFADANALGGPALRRRRPAHPHRLPVLRRERDARAASTRPRCAAPASACRVRASGLRPADRARDAPRADRHVARLQRVAARLPRRRLAEGGRSRRIGARAAEALPGPGPQRVRDEARRRRARWASASSPTSRATGPPPPRPARREHGGAGAASRGSASSGRSRPAASSTCPAPGSSPGRGRHRRDRRLRRPAGPHRPRAEHLDQLRRDPRQRRRRRPQRLRGRRPRRRPDLQAEPPGPPRRRSGTAPTSRGSSPRPGTAAASSASPPRPG